MLVFSQDKKWEFGINVGGYKANKHTTIRYDGADVEYSNYNLDVEYYYGLSSTNTNSVYNRVKQSYGDLDWEPSVDAYPTDMRYNIGLDLGVHLGYFSSETTIFFVDANFANIKVNDALTITVDDPNTQTTQNDIRVESLTGEERRLTVNPGVQFLVGESADASPYISFGPNLTWTRVDKNSMIIQGNEYVLTQYSRNSNNIYSVADFGGIGFGGFAGVGYRYRLRDQIVLDFGYTGMFTKIGLGPDFNKAFKLQSSFYMRIMWS